MKIGFVYAGQGSQYVGMGQDFYDRFEEYKNSVDLAQRLLKKAAVDIKALSFNGPKEELDETRNTQPAMVTFAVGVTNLLKKAGIKPEYTFGLSLGEYSALYCAGVFDEASVIDIAAKRGSFMQEASYGLDVKMVAVLGLEKEIVVECCKKATADFDGTKVVSAVNFNCPGQIVVSGETQGVERACEYLKQAGAKRIMPLNVSGPFHTKLMSKAGERLVKELKKIELNPMQVKVIFNCLGREKEDETIDELLEKQVQSPVYLEDSIRYMGKQGVDTVVEIGPGKTISKFIKRTLPDMRVLSIETVEDYERAVAELLA